MKSVIEPTIEKSAGEGTGWSEEAFRADLAKACKSVDALPDLKGAAFGSEVRILRKLEVLGGILSQHNRPLGGNRSHVRPAPMALDLIQHAGARVTPRIRVSIDALATEHRGSRWLLRHEPERAIDLMLDKYQAQVVGRGYGTPRARGSLKRIDLKATAEEVGCTVDQFGEIARRRLVHINSLVDRPGKLTGIDEGAKHHLVNPASTIMLRAGAARYKDGFPEDPLRPGLIDQITVANDCGIGMKDLQFSPDNVRLLDELRGDKPLIPHPCIAARRYTYADLLEAGLKERDKELEGTPSGLTLARRTSKSLTDFLGIAGVGGKLSDFVPVDFKQRVLRALAAGPSRFGSHWKADMRRWIGYNRNVRADLPLPNDIGLSLRVLLAESGLPNSKVAIDAKVNRHNLQNWANGWATPSHNQQDSLDSLANYFGVKPERLTASVSDDWRLHWLDIDHPDFAPEMGRYIPDGFEKLGYDEQTKLLRKLKSTHFRQNTASSRRQVEQSRDKYRLKQTNWPEAIKAAWALQYADTTKDEHEWKIRKPGEVIVERDKEDPLSASDRPLRPATVEFHRVGMESMLGYFVRPRMLTEEQKEQAAMLDQSMTTNFRPQAGLGIPIELLHPVIFAIPDLISSYVWWRCHRSGVQSRLVLHMLNLPARFLRPNSGVVWDQEALDALERFKEWWDANPHDLSEGSLKLDISAFRENWKEAVKKAYTTLALDHRTVRRGSMPNSRDPFLPINAVLNTSAPLETYMIGVHNMLASRPAKAMNKHVHLRDCILMLILLQTGLRASTMLFDWADGLDGSEAAVAQSAKEEAEQAKKEIRIFRSTDADGSPIWQIRIAADVFKNYFSSFFQGGQPYEYVLRDEDDLYEKLDRYVAQARPYMLRGRRTKSFFVTQFGTDIDGDEIRDIFYRITRYYFVERPSISKEGEDDEEPMGIPGMMIHGPHAIRHIIATHIVKTTGSVHLAAWAIQDSYATVAKHYARFFPRDKVVIAMKALEDARANAREAANARAAAAAARLLEAA